MVDVIDADLADQIGYSGTQAAKVVGISYRQLDYWARTDLIRPSLTDAAGSGSRRRYSYADLLELKTIKKLIDAGHQARTGPQGLQYLRTHVSTDIASAHIVIDGGHVMLCDGDELIDVLKHGQGVLNVLSLSGVKDELEADLAADIATIETRLVNGRRHPSHRLTSTRWRCQTSPLDDRTGSSVRRWPNSVDGRCRSRIRRARSPNTWRAAHRRRSSTCRISAPCGSTGPDAFDVIQTHSPTISARSVPAGRSTPICSTRPTGRCSTTSSCGGTPTTPGGRCST